MLTATCADETAFLDALRADPADVTTRVVYADWLDEYTDRHDGARVLRGELEVERVRALFGPHPSLDIRVHFHPENPRTSWAVHDVVVPPLPRPVVRFRFADDYVMHERSVVSVAGGAAELFVAAVGMPNLLYGCLVPRDGTFTFAPGFAFTPDRPMELLMRSREPCRARIDTSFVRVKV